MPTRTPAEHLALYLTWLDRTGLSEGTRDVYATRATQFITWLEGRGPEYFDALTDTDVRDYAVKEYRRELLVTAKKAPATVQLHMSSIGSFFDHLGLGKPEGVAVEVPAAGREGLRENDLRKLMLAMKRRGPRDYAIGAGLENTGVRVSELAAIDLDDFTITDRTGQLLARFGKGGKPRTVPLNSAVRVAWRAWLDVRPETPEHGALFTNRSGGRLGVRSLQRTLHDAGASVGVHVTPHILRHTFGRNLLADGADIAVVGNMMGHRDPKTTMIYTKPKAEDYVDAVERISREDA